MRVRIYNQTAKKRETAARQIADRISSSKHSPRRLRRPSKDDLAQMLKEALLNTVLMGEREKKN